MSSILNFFSKMIKGNEGEDEVLLSITQLLRNSDKEDNFFLLQKVKIPDMTRVVEIDLLLLHPTLGIYVIEVKNWKSLEYLNQQNNPFEQITEYRNLLLSFLSEKMGKVPINIEPRVIFPSISKSETDSFYKNNAYYSNFNHHTFFKDEIKSKNLFQSFFNSSNGVIPNKKEFMQVASLLMNKESIKKSKDKIIPVITKDEILFFDHKQLSILNGYSGGFRIIRGVAGTGKTIILTNFIQNKLEIDSKNKFLIVCFNKRLSENISNSFEDKHKKNVIAYSLFSLLTRIQFDWSAINVHYKTPFEEKFEQLKTPEATQEFQRCFRAQLRTHPIDYFLCDETQDMPANIMRVIYEEIGDCIFFIDESQKFYRYSMDSIAEVFHHKKFEKINMSGRVKNLKNVYRTPSNIAQCAFEILSLDKSINNYYKKSFYLKEGFLSDIKFVLEDGSIKIGEYDSQENLLELVKKIDDETVILTQYKKDVKTLNEQFKTLDYKVNVMTFQSIKGLEAKNIILHNFDSFLLNSLKNDKEILFRKVYVLLTRALENVYISLESEDKLLEKDELCEIIEIIKRHEKNLSIEQSFKTANEKESVTKRTLKLATLTPNLKKAKESGEIVIVASELFALVSGIFS